MQTATSVNRGSIQALRGHTRGEYAQVFNKSVLRSAERLPEKLDYDSRLLRTKLGDYYLCIPMPLEVKHENQVLDHNIQNNDNVMASVISLDPGVRTFQTGYDPSGLVIECGKYDVQRIYRLCYHLDKL